MWARAGHLVYDQFLAEQNVTPAFIIVRHPLTRLASAFRNKLQSDTRTGEYFIEAYARIISIKARGSWTAGDPDPTFPEFVKYLIKSKPKFFDEHWMPISLRCRVCQVSFDYILHYEDLQSDWAQFLREVNITEDIRLPWDNRGEASYSSYYHNITRDDLESLYDKYEADFLMFGYSLDQIY